MPLRETIDDPAAVDAFFAASSHPLVASARRVHATLLTAAPGVTTGIKWNAPSLHAGPDWFATFQLRKPTEFAIVLHRGAKVRPAPPARFVNDPHGLLKWMTLDRAVLTFRDSTNHDQVLPALRAIAAAWVERMRRELAVD